jgi:hypothetical protein
MSAFGPIGSGGGGGSGDTTGAASSTDNAVVRFDGTSGKLLQNSGLIVDDSNNITSPGTINGTTIPTSKTLVVTTDKLSVHASTSSSELAGVISDETGTGALVFANTPTLVTPVLGVATATSINNAVITAALTVVQQTNFGGL